MEDKAYKFAKAHLITSFQMGHTEDGEFMSITVTLSSGKSVTIAIPFAVQHKFVEDAGREFAECSRRVEWRNDYRDKE